MVVNDGGSVAESGWFNLAQYILDPEEIIYKMVRYILLIQRSLQSQRIDLSFYEIDYY